MSKINKFKWTYGLFGHNYRVAALSTFYLTVSVIIPSLKMIKIFMFKWTYCRSGIGYRVASLFTRYLTAIGIIPENLN